MLRLRKILLLKTPYIILLALALFYTTITLTLYPRTSVYQEKEVELVGIIESIHRSLDKLTIQVKAKENVLVMYYLKSEDEIEKVEQFHLGDEIRIQGEMKKPFSTQNFYSFSYSKYLENRNIFFILHAKTIKKERDNQNLLLLVRDITRRYISSLGEASNYIDCFFLGKDDDISADVTEAFQKIGISHLFALSGTQTSFLLMLIGCLMRKMKKSDLFSFYFSFILLVQYYTLIDSCATIDRALVFSFLFGINKAYNFFISPFQLICLSLAVLLFINPYYLFDIGFQYSTVISVGLIIYYQNQKQKKNRLFSLLEVSFLSFLLSLPISLYHFSFINPLSILYNLFYVPFINVFVFPLSIFTFFCPFLRGILLFLIHFLEQSVLLLNQIPFGELIFRRVPLFVYILYFFLVFVYILKKKRAYLLLLSCLLFLHFLYPKVIKEEKLYMIDVHQGDSFLLISDGKSMMIDTGGKMDYQKEKWARGKEEKGIGKYTISFLHQLGITKLDFLVLTHGDEDHAKEALTLLQEIPVDTVFFNENKENKLEKRIRAEAEKKGSRIETLHQNDQFFLGNYSFQVLSQNLEDENDSSLILYTTIFHYRMLFMGDASKKSEETIMKHYQMVPLTILKVGHHGSKTSSSKKFLAQVRPKYALISSGRDNKFHHPHDGVVKSLKKLNAKIYNTQDVGMVCFDFKKNSITTYQDKIAKKIEDAYNNKRRKAVP